jgi:hypothetical protein
MDSANANLLDVIAEGQAALLVAQIERVAGLHDIDEGTQGGTAALHVVRALTPQRWHGPAELEVEFSQYKSPQLRMREGGQGWNGLDVEPGKTLLLAVADIPESERKYVRSPATVAALVVVPLDSTADATVQGTEQALTIEATSDVQRRTALLKTGLSSELEVFSGYSHYALGRLKRIPRESAAALELELLHDETKPMPRRLDAQANLELELWDSEAPADPVNHRILEAFFKALALPVPELQRPLVLALYSFLVTDAPADQNAAAAYRSQLLQGLSWPPKDRLLASLQAAEKNPDLATEAAWLRDFVSRR